MGAPDIPAEYDKSSLDLELVNGLVTLNKFICTVNDHDRSTFLSFYNSLYNFPDFFTGNMSKDYLEEKFKELYNDISFQRFIDGFNRAVNDDIVAIKDGKVYLTSKGNNLLKLANELNGHQMFSWSFVNKLIDDSFNLEGLLKGSFGPENGVLLKDPENNMLIRYFYYNSPITNEKVNNFSSILFLPSTTTKIFNKLDNIKVIGQNQNSKEKVDYSIVVDKVKKYLASNRKTIEMVPSIMDNYMYNYSDQLILLGYNNDDKIQTSIDLSDTYILNKVFGDKVKFRVDLDQATNQDESKLTLLGTVDDKVVFFKEINKNSVHQDELNDNMNRITNKTIFSLAQIFNSEAENGN